MSNKIKTPNNLQVNNRQYETIQVMREDGSQIFKTYQLGTLITNRDYRDSRIRLSESNHRLDLLWGWADGLMSCSLQSR